MNDIRKSWAEKKYPASGEMKAWALWVIEGAKR